MGCTPTPRVPRPQDRESFHLGIARAAFIAGSIDVAEFEVAVAHVLAGGGLTQDARVPAPGEPPAARNPGKPERR